MIKNYLFMVCVLAGLTFFYKKCEAAAQVKKPAYVSFSTAMGGSRKDVLSRHRSHLITPPYQSDSDDSDTGIDQSEYPALGTKFRKELQEADEDCTEHHLLELGRECVEEGVVPFATRFKQCAKASNAVFCAHWASFGSHRELYRWVKNYLEQRENSAREEYIAGMKLLDGALEREEDTDELCAKQLELSQALTKATQARENPDDSVKHAVLVALEEKLGEEFGIVLARWVAELGKGNEAKELEEKKCAIGRQLDVVRIAKDQAYYRLRRQQEKGTV
jgi:hypothetical protein